MTDTGTRLGMAFRHPRRITITVSRHIHEELLQRSDEEGRSLSNLACFLLELALNPGGRPRPHHERSRI